MKKILSIALMLTMILSCVGIFASCDALTAAAVVQQADEALLNTPYVMTMSMDFECDDAEMNAIFDALSMDIPVTVDGENMLMEMSMEIMEGMSARVKMTVFDKVLYYDMAVAGQTVKMKATMNEEDYAEFLKENSATMPVDPSQFETLTLETKEGKQVVTCAGITEEGRAALNEIMGDTVGSIDASAAIGELSFVLTVSGGKYESMALTVDYSVTAAGKTINVSMTMNAKFSYTDVAPITAPADADKYTEMDIADLLG